MIPRATYRLQFHRGFGFADGASLAPYLARLGISHLYSSPIQTARKGSTHGYDIVDHATINPELGGRDGFLEMAKALRAHHIGIILDIVPNHMFVGDGSNVWWQDVLESGVQSRFAHHFDIDWDPPDHRLRGKVLLPCLGLPYAETLSSGALRLIFDKARGKLGFSYYDRFVPLRREDYADVLRGRSPETADLRTFSAVAATHALLERQNYELAWWQCAGDRINWRRFFDINELAGLRVEQDDVFEAVHALPLELYAGGLVDGFRVDHVDGLADPVDYCRRLRARLANLEMGRPPEAASGPAYLVVEKILAGDEILPADWQVDGTTGYEFLSEVSGLQHNPDGEAPLAALWQRLSHRSANFEEEQRTARSQILDAFEAQLFAVARAFAEAARRDCDYHDISAPTLRRAIRGLIASLDSYRAFLSGNSSALLPQHLERAAMRAKSGATDMERASIDFIVVALAGHKSGDLSVTADAARRFNQLASAVAAKGVEDTAFYRHIVLISRNEIGSDPSQFSISPAAFHSACARRGGLSPNTMIATATHDHKRGEDARARLAVLSEIPSRWEGAVGDWLELTEGVRPDLVETSECYHLFQTLVGAWPLDLAVQDRDSLEQFATRILAWRTKSLREAKLKTSWTAIDPSYETAHADFVGAVLDAKRSSRFLKGFRTFVDDIAPAGTANALAQTVLRLTTPGVPDTYQGTEFWDFSLVDPDNRRDVDFALRERAMDLTLSRWREYWRDGRIKQFLIARLLTHRATYADLFAGGSYSPLELRGKRSLNVLAFERRHKGRSLIVGVSRFMADALVGGETIVPPQSWWEDTEVLVTADAGRTIRDVLEPSRTLQSGRNLRVSDLMSDIPLFVLQSED